jgi:predicted secreted protein
MPPVITEAENGQELSLYVHDSFQLQLPEARMGGYRWEVLQAGEPVLKVAELKTQVPGSLPGQSNIGAWQFTVEQPGSAQIQLQHRRSWEHNKPARLMCLCILCTALGELCGDDFPCSPRTQGPSV